MNVGVRLLYVIATLALFPALITLIPIASGSTASATTWWAFAVSWAVVVACLGVEWRRDRYAVAMFGTVFSFMVAMVAGSLTVLDGRGEVMLRGGIVAVLAAAVLIACIVVIVRERRMKDEVPDHLLARLGPGGLFETEGVVWGATAEAAGGPRSGPALRARAGRAR